MCLELTENTTHPFLRLKQNGRRGHAVRVYLMCEARQYPELMGHLGKRAKDFGKQVRQGWEVLEVRLPKRKSVEGHKKPVQKFIALNTAACLDASFLADSLKVEVPSTGEFSGCFLSPEENL